ncbi:hypothetical protein GEMRC1_012594 [Eukaryota sp. GEM-RC1]
MISLDSVKDIYSQLATTPVPVNPTLHVTKEPQCVTARVNYLEKYSSYEDNSHHHVLSQYTITVTSNGDSITKPPSIRHSALAISEINDNHLFCFLTKTNDSYSFDFYSDSFICSIPHPISSTIHTSGPLVRSGIFHWIDNHRLLFIAESPKPSSSSSLLDNLDCAAYKPTLGEQCNSTSPMIWIADLNLNETYPVYFSSEIIPVDCLSPLSPFPLKASPSTVSTDALTPLEEFTFATFPSLKPPINTSLPLPSHFPSTIPAPLDGLLVLLVLSFLSSESPTHNAGASLFCVELRDGKVLSSRTVFSASEGKANLPAIWTTVLPVSCFNSDGDSVYFNSEKKFKTGIFKISLKSGVVQELDQCDDSINDTTITSTELIAIKDDVLLVKEDSFWMAPRFNLIVLNHIQNEMISVSLSPANSKINQNKINCRLVPHQSRDGYLYDSLLLNTNSTNKVLCVLLHGGYAAQILSNFNLIITTLLKSGISVLIPNYPGSSGYDLATSQSLNGRIGDSDVEAVKNAIDDVTSAFGFSKVSLCGGSHGGFLTLSLISKYPNSFINGVVRNPVTDLYYCALSSDIPNWAFHSIGLPIESIPTDKIVSEFFNRSPMSSLHQIRCPVQFHVGDSDLRVPMGQSLAMYSFMKARGQDVRCFVHEGENHSLSGPKAMALFVLNLIKSIGENI